MTSADFKARVLAAAAREPSPTRRARTMRIALVVVGSVSIGLGVFFVLGGAHLGQRAMPFVVGTIGGWVGVAFAAALIAFGRGRSMLGRGRSWLLGVALVAPLVLFGWMLLWNRLYPESVAGSGPRLGFRCLGLTLGIATVPLIGLARSLRERDPIHPAATGAARGVAAGALVGVLVDLWCPLAESAHVALGHVGPLLLLALLGGILGSRWSGVRHKGD